MDRLQIRKYYLLEIQANPLRATSIIEIFPFFSKLRSPASPVET